MQKKGYKNNKWTRIHREHRVKSKRYIDYAKEALQHQTLNREEKEAITRGIKKWSSKGYRERIESLSLGL